MMEWLGIVVAALWGYRRGVKAPGATRGRVVLLAGVSGAAAATLLVILSAGSLGEVVGGEPLAYGYWVVGYAFVVGAVVAVVGLVARGVGEWMGRGP